ADRGAAGEVGRTGQGSRELRQEIRVRMGGAGVRHPAVQLDGQAAAEPVGQVGLDPQQIGVAGDAYLLGIEADLAYRFGGGLTIELNSRVSHARTAHPNPDFLAQLPTSLPGAPNFSGGATIS